MLNSRLSKETETLIDEVSQYRLWATRQERKGLVLSDFPRALASLEMMNKKAMLFKKPNLRSNANESICKPKPN